MFDQTSKGVRQGGQGKASSAPSAVPGGQRQPAKGYRLAYSSSAAYTSASGAAELRWRSDRTCGLFRTA